MNKNFYGKVVGISEYRNIESTLISSEYPSRQSIYGIYLKLQILSDTDRYVYVNVRKNLQEMYPELVANGRDFDKVFIKRIEKLLLLNTKRFSTICMLEYSDQVGWILNTKLKAMFRVSNLHYGDLIYETERVYKGTILDVFTCKELRSFLMANSLRHMETLESSEIYMRVEVHEIDNENIFVGVRSDFMEIASEINRKICKKLDRISLQKISENIKGKEAEIEFNEYKGWKMWNSLVFVYRSEE